MITREDLETLSSRPLHERAVGLAKTEGVIDWLWHLLGSIQAAEGQLGELDDSGLDIASLITAINGGFNLLVTTTGCSFVALGSDRINPAPMLARLGNYGGPT